MLSRNDLAHAIAEAEICSNGFHTVVATMITYTQDFMLPRWRESSAVWDWFIDNPRHGLLEIVPLHPVLPTRVFEGATSSGVCVSLKARHFLPSGREFQPLALTATVSSYLGQGPMRLLVS
jgi:hypothetical protein